MAKKSNEELRRRYSRVASGKDETQAMSKETGSATTADRLRARYATRNQYNTYTSANRTPSRYDGSAVLRYMNAYGLNQQRQADRQQEARNRYNQQQFMNTQRDLIRNGYDNGNNPLGLKNLDNPLDRQRRINQYEEQYNKTHNLSLENAQKLEKAYGNADRQQLEKLKEHFETARDRDYSGELEWVKEKLLTTATGKENEARQSVLKKQISSADERLQRLYDTYAKKNIYDGKTDEFGLSSRNIEDDALKSPEYQAKKEAIEKEKKSLENELMDYQENINYRDSDDFEKYKEKGDKDSRNAVRFYRNNTDQEIADYWENQYWNRSTTQVPEQYAKDFENDKYNKAANYYTGRDYMETSDQDLIRAITDEEADNYSYILGKYGEDKANEYLQNIAKHTDVNGALTKMQEAKKEGASNPIKATAESIGLGLLTPFEAIKNATGFGGDFRTYDDYKLAGRQEALRSGVAQNIANTTGDDTVLPFLYNTATSTADNLLRYAVGGGVGALSGNAGAAEGTMRLMMGGQVMDSAMKQALDRGLTDSEAVTTAIISAINEELFETISIEKLKFMQLADPQNYRELAKNVGKQILAEGSEEVFTDIGNAIADDLVNGEKSEIATNIRKYMDQGLSEEEAKKKAAVDFAMQLVESGLSGGLSGAAMGGAVTVSQFNDIDNQKRYNKLAEAYMDAGMSAEDAYSAAYNDALAGIEEKYDENGNVVKQTGLKKSLNQAVKSAAVLNENIQRLENEMNSGVVDNAMPINDAEIRYNEAQNEYLDDLKRVLDTKVKNDEDYSTVLNQADALAEKYPERRNDIARAVDSVFSDGANKEQVLEDLRTQTTNTKAENETSLKQPINASEVGVANNETTKMEFKAAVNGNEGTITSVNNDKITIKDATGNEQTVKVKDAEMSDGAKAAVEQAKQYGKRGSKLYLANLTSDNVRKYTLAFNTFYNAGKNGKTFYGNKTLGVNPTVLREAYYAGVADNSKSAKQGGLIKNEARYKINEAEARVLDAMGKKYGVTVQIDNMISNDANGLYDSDNDIIHISANAENPALVVFSHEFTHRLEETSPDAYKEYENYVIDYLKEVGVYETREQSLKQLYKNTGIELSEKDVRSEIAANATETFLTDTEAIEAFVANNKTLAEKIIDVIKNMIADLKDSLSNFRNPKSVEAQAIRNGIDSFDKALELWIKAAERQEAKTESDKTQFSLKEMSDKELEKSYDEAVNKLYDMNLASEIVKQYAYNKGFTKELYHGTTNFGFTKLDTSKSDDNLSFFTASTPELASTYSTTTETKKISDYKVKSLDEVVEHIKRVNDLDNIKVFKRGDIKTRLQYLEDLYTEMVFDDSFSKFDKEDKDNITKTYDNFIDYLYEDNVDYDKALQLFKELDEAIPYNPYNMRITRAVWDLIDDDNINHDVIIGGDINGEKWNVFDYDDFISEKGNYEFYANLDNFMKINANNRNWDSIKYEGKYYNTRELAKIAKDKGYDGIQIDNVIDNGGRNVNYLYDNDIEAETIYNFFNPQEQLKSADAVTYDDEGNVIPLSERFNKSNDDIRFSLKEESNITRNDVAALTGKDPYMAEAVKDLEDIMRMKGGEAFFRANQKELYKIYDEIAEEYNIKDYSKKMFADNVKELFDYIQSTDNPDGVDITMLGMQIAADMLDKGTMIDNSFAVEYPTLQDEIRNYKIKIADQDKADLDGGYNTFRKNHFGSLTLANDGTEVDSVYEDLAASYPELFTEDITHPADRLTRIADVADMFKKTVDHIEGATREESAFIIAQDIINKAVLEQTKNNKSIDSKKRVKAQEKVRKQSTDIKKAKKDIHDEYVRLQKKVKALESINERLSRKLTKAENDLGRQKKEFADWAMGKRQVNKEDKYYKQRYDKLKEEFAKKKVAELQKKYSAERRKNIEKIRKMVNELDRSVRRPDKNHYIPKYLVSSMLDVLRTIDLDSGYRKPDGSETLVYMKLKEMQKQYQEMKNDMDYAIASEYNETIDKAIGRLAEITKGRRLNELLDKDIADIVEIMEIITYQMRTARDLLENEKLSDIKEASQKAREQIKEAGRTFNTDAKLKNLFNRYLNNSLSPVRVMRRLEGYAHDGVLSSLGEELQQGERKTKLIRQTAYEMLDELYKDTKAIKALEKFRSEKLTYNIGGKNIVITPDMRAAIYLHSLNEQNMKHVVGNKTKEGSYRGGGIIIPNYQKQMKFNNRDSVKINAAEKYTGQDAVRLSPSDVDRIIKDMTEYDKRIVELYQQVNEYLTKELNDTTMNLYGFKKATVKNYFPLIVDKSILNLDTDALKFDKTLESFGFLKERVNSAKPIYLEGVMDALERQIDQSSLFSGMAIPSRDFKKVWNYAAMDENDKFDNVNKQAQKAMGSYIDKYVGNLQADLAQARERGDKFGLLSAFSRGKMATGVLTGNLSVVLKQAASYPTAAGGVLGYRDLLAGLTPKGQRGKTLEKTINKYTPLYQDRNTAGIVGVNINDMNILKRRNPKLYYALTGWIESMDKATVRRLWYASENYVKRNFDYKVGSDDYYEEVAKVWEDTIRRTQPIYDTMNRPEFLRQTNEIGKFLMMFKTQALQNVGIIVDGYGELKVRERDYNKDKSDFNKMELDAAKKQWHKVLFSQALQLAVFTAITALGDAIKHRPKDWTDEETGLVTPESFMKHYGDAYISNAISQLVMGEIIRDVTYEPVKKFIIKKVTGKTIKTNRYDLSIPPVDAINTLINSFDKTIDAVNDRDFEKAKMYTKQFVSTAAQYGGGIPVKNIENLFKGLEGNIKDIEEGKNPLEASNEKQMYNRVYIAYQSGNKAEAEKLSKDLDQDKLKTKMVSKLKDEETIQEAADYRYNSDLVAYQAIVDAYVKLGFNEDWVVSAINSDMNKKYGTKGSVSKGSTYNSSDLNRAIEISAVQGSKVAQELYNEKYNAYIAEGMSKEDAKKKAMSSVKASITSEYKPKFESGNTSEKIKIRDRLSSIKVNGKKLYTYDSIKKWNK